MMYFVCGTLDRDVSDVEAEAQMNLYMKLFKSAYDAGLKGSGKMDDVYYYGKDLEEKMLDIFEAFKGFVVQNTQ